MMTGNKVWLDAAIHLYENNIAEPVFWLGDDCHLQYAKEVFGENVLCMDDFVHYQQNIKNIDYFDQHTKFFLSENYLRAKDRCLKMMDRLDLYGAFSRQDREVIFNKLAIFILKKLEKSKPEALIMAEAAHSHAQYLTLEICMYLDIEIVKFNTWMLAPLLYMQNMKTGERFDVDKEMNEELSQIVDDDIRNYIEGVLATKNNEGFEPEYMKKQRLGLTTKNYIINFFNTGFIQLIKEAWLQLRKNFNSDYYNINPYRFGLVTRSKIKRLRRKNLITEHNREKDLLNLNQKYVYFGLHFEPERTTNPDGGSFHDQALAIIALRNILPSEINIIVKEHPSQFYVFDRGSRGRSPLFYDLIKNISGVQLASYKEQSHSLIQGSEFTSTISGTLALESAILGKKSLIFGDSWFDSCPNIISWNNEITFDQIIQEEILDPKSILDFLLETRKLKTVIGCQNTSTQITYKKYLSHEAFFQEEFDGVTHLLEKFFFTLGSTNN
tara:strand:+ start:26731 stop:28221 length:1491 start_codon:yes stop_codon:yes gene_type:complete